jgi:hypothetical protein
MLVCRACRKVHIQWGCTFVPSGADRPVTVSRVCPHCGAPTIADQDPDDALALPLLYDSLQIDGARTAIREAFAWAEQIVGVGYEISAADAPLFESIADRLQSNTHPQIDMWLVMEDQDEADSLRDRLLFSNALPAMRDDGINLRPTAWAD